MYTLNVLQPRMLTQAWILCIICSRLQPVRSICNTEGTRFSADVCLSPRLFSFNSFFRNYSEKVVKEEKKKALQLDTLVAVETLLVQKFRGPESSRSQNGKAGSLTTFRCNIRHSGKRCKEREKKKKKTCSQRDWLQPWPFIWWLTNWIM